jgi:sulfatase maturation enzyme AslB (radical SAM superfamily)
MRAAAFSLVMYNFHLGDSASFMAEETKAVRATAKTRLRRWLRFLRTRARELKMIGKALVSTKHPILVHIIPMRQCNLACTYCNEYDDFSKPVPL